MRMGRTMCASLSEPLWTQTIRTRVERGTDHNMIVGSDDDAETTPNLNLRNIGNHGWWTSEEDTRYRGGTGPRCWTTQNNTETICHTGIGTFWNQNERLTLHTVAVTSATTSPLGTCWITIMIDH
jgi:hypothetical protein